MAKLLKKNRIIYFFIITIISSLLCIFASGKKDNSIDLTSTLISSNYICLILNNLYIHYMYTRCKKIKCIYDKIITRIGQKLFFNSYLLNSVIDIVVFFLIVAIPIYIKHGINNNYLILLIVYCFIYFLNFFIQECISMLTFLMPKGNFFICIPVFMNFGFHYMIIPLLIQFLFHY